MAVRYQGEEVRRLVFLCVPGDGARQRPRRGMVPLVAGAEWDDFASRVRKRLGLVGEPRIYAWDGGPRIESIHGLLEVDEGRTLVVMEEAAGQGPGDAGPECAASVGEPSSLRAHLSICGGGGAGGPGSVPPYTPLAASSACTVDGRAGVGSTPVTAVATSRMGAEARADHRALGNSSANVDSGGAITINVAPPPPGTGGDGSFKGGQRRGSRDPEEDKYRKRRRWRSTARLGAAAASDGKLSLTRIAGMLCALTVLSCFFLWLFAVRDEEVMERIREHTGGLHAHAVARGPGPGGGGALSSTGGSSSL